MDTETEIAERAELARSFARCATREAQRALRARGRFVLALPGGSAAEAFVPALAASAIAWPRVDLVWVDERAVPADDPDSNYGLAWRRGLGALALAPQRVHRLRGEASDLERAAQEGERALRRALGSPPRIDLALVGVGADGHLAALFPGRRALEERRRWVVPVVDAPKPPPRRLTVTLPVFALVDLLVVAAFGAEKADVVRAAVEEPGSELPLARAARLAKRRLFLLDAAAASAISG